MNQGPLFREKMEAHHLRSPERAEIRNRRRGREVPRQSRVLRRRITLDTIDDCSQAETPSGQVISICGGMIRAPIRVSATSK